MGGGFQVGWMEFGDGLGDLEDWLTYSFPQPTPVPQQCPDPTAGAGIEDANCWHLGRGSRSRSRW